MALLWHNLSQTIGMPSGQLKVVWENIVGAAYMCMLDAFSKIPFCSTEGRALMSMDVSAFNNGTRPSSIIERLEDDELKENLLNHQQQVIPPKDIQPQCIPPKDVQPHRNFVDVSTYIKIFYFPSNVSKVSVVVTFVCLERFCILFDLTLLPWLISQYITGCYGMDPRKL
jgi:hypothetical protein